jgi:hypothetical protein
MQGQKTVGKGMQVYKVNYMGRTKDVGQARLN